MISDYYGTLTLKTVTVGQDAGGFPTQSVEESSFQGLINQASSREKALYQQYPSDSLFKLFCPVTVAVTKNSLINDGAYDYLVVSEPKNTIGLDHHYKVMLQLINV